MKYPFRKKLSFAIGVALVVLFGPALDVPAATLEKLVQLALIFLPSQALADFAEHRKPPSDAQ